ncbi:MAG: A24 family peptidase [Alphaproteobacteria bacterium]|nr:A24 family peptidase [Alphaproteobacteria bacterium]
MTDTILQIVHITVFISIFGVMIALAAIDVKHYILPDVLNAALGILFLAFHQLAGWHLISPTQALIGALAGGGMLLAIRCAANAYYKADTLGLGDVKLMTAAGLGLGFPDILMALSLGAMVGLGHGIIMGINERRRGNKNASFAKVNVPAGLGLCVGIAIMFLIAFQMNWLA